MHRLSKLLLAGLATALLCSAIAGSASARNLSQNEQRFKITFAPLSFVPSFGSTFIRCRVTLEGSMHTRTFAKVAESLIGYINRAVFGPCEAGSARANTETLPWHITYGGFTGTLPNITGLQETIHNLSYEIPGELFGLRVRCRYNIATERFSSSITRGVQSAMRPGAESNSSATEGCPSFRLEGTGTVTTPTGGSVVITLI